MQGKNALKVSLENCTYNPRYQGQYRPIAGHYSRKVADLVQVLLRPVPDRRPSAEMLITASKLEAEVKQYLGYVK